MIDAVTLCIEGFDPQDIYAPDMFESPISDFGTHYHVYNRKPPKGTYWPQVIFRKYIGQYPKRVTTKLIVKCSVPKVLYGNNLVEVCETDKMAFCTELVQRLDQMGITLTATDILQAKVQGFEYSKNILLGRIPVSFVLRELARSQPIQHTMDIQQSAYRNGGEKLVFYSSGYEIVFYDKTFELSKEMKHKKCNLPEQIRKDIESGKLNVLRMEFRFHNQKSWKNILKDDAPYSLFVEEGRLYYPPIRCYVFEHLFTQILAKRLLNRYWHRISDKARKTPMEVFDPAYELWRVATYSNKHLKPQALLAKLGTHYLVRGVGHHEAVRTLKRLGYTNVPQFITQNTGRISRVNWRLDIWRFIDHSLSRFSCLTLPKLTHLKKRTSAVWFKRYESFLTVQEVAEQLNVSPKVIRREIAHKQLVAYKIGKCICISRTALAAYLNRCLK